MSVDFGTASRFDVEYQLRIYAPRSEDNTEATLLAPLADAPHADDFIVNSRQDRVGKPYLEVGDPRSAKTNPLEKKIDSAEISVTILDKRTGEENDDRWFTAFIGGPDGVNRLAGCRAVILQRLGPDHEEIYFVGRVESVEMQDRVTMTLRIGDMLPDFDVELFGKGSVNGAAGGSAQLFPPGPLYNTTWGGGDPTPLALGFMGRDNMANEGPLRNFPGLKGFARVYIGSQDDRDRYGENSAVLGDIATRLNTLIWESDPNEGRDFETKQGLRLQIVTSSDPTLVGKAYQLQGGYDFEKDDERRFVQHFLIKPLPTDDPQYAPFPGSLPNSKNGGPRVTFYVTGGDGASSETPILIEGTPAEVVASILDGDYTRSKQPFNYDAASLAAVFDGHPLTRLRFWITEPKKLLEWLAKDICAPMGIGFTLRNVWTGGAPRQDIAFYDARFSAALEAGDVDVITSGDLAANAAPTWKQARRDAIQILQIDTKYYPIGSALAKGGSAEKSEPIRNVLPLNIDPGSIVPVGVQYVQVDGQGEIGSKVHVMEAPGLLITNKDSQAERDTIFAYMREIADDYRRLYANGPVYVTLKTLRTGNTQACDVGDFRTLDVDELPNPLSKRRGGPRLALCISREDDGPYLNLGFMEFAGLELTDSDLALTSLTADATRGTFSVAVAGIDAGEDPVELWAIRTANDVVAAPADNASGWYRLGVSATPQDSTVFRDVASGGSTGVNAYAATNGTWHSGPLEEGQRLWVRGRQASTTNARIPGPWVSAGYVEFGGAFLAPTSLAATNITPRSAMLTWVNTYDDYPIAFMVATPVGGTEYVRATLPAGTTSFLMQGLETSGSDDFRVRIQYVDANLGRRSFHAIVEFNRETPSGPQQASPDVLGISVIAPLETQNNDEDAVYGLGVRVQPATAGWPIEVQVYESDTEPDPMLTDPDDRRITTGGEVRTPTFRMVFPRSTVSGRCWVRARHVGNAAEPGAWSVWADGTAGLLPSLDPSAEAIGPDSFVGVLPVSKGGTGQDSLDNEGILIGSGTGPVRSLRGTVNGQLAMWDGTKWGPSTISFDTPDPVPAAVPVDPIFTPSSDRWDTATVEDQAVAPYDLGGTSLAPFTNGDSEAPPGGVGLELGATSDEDVDAADVTNAWVLTGTGAALPIDGEVVVRFRVRGSGGNPAGTLKVSAYRADTGAHFLTHEIDNTPNAVSTYGGVWASTTATVLITGSPTNWNKIIAPFTGVPDCGLIIMVHKVIVAPVSDYEVGRFDVGVPFITGGYTSATGTLPAAPGPTDSPVSGVLRVANGGTGVATVPAGNLLLGDGTDPMAPLAGTTIGELVAWDGAAWAASGVLGALGMAGPLTATVANLQLRTLNNTSGSAIEISNGDGTVAAFRVLGNGTVDLPLGSMRQGSSSRAANISSLFNTLAGYTRLHIFQSAGSNRWVFGVNNTGESGSNNGSNFQITRYSDAGGSLGNVLFINRASGLMTLSNGLTITAGDLTVTAGDILMASAISRIRAGATSFAIRNNANSADNLLITNAGDITIRGKVGFNGTTPLTAPVMPADASDPATSYALANAIKAALVNYGLAT